MAEVFVVSDTHFNHANILKFTDKNGQFFRIFDDVHHMNETMIENWNRVVRPEDKIYHLGDVFLGDGEGANAILKRLNGKKRLILGNHDEGKNQVLYRHFQKITMWRRWDDLGLLLTHVPIHESSLRVSRFTGKQLVNVHGHIHQNDSPPGPYVNVCVEKTGYSPVHIEELAKKCGT